MKIRSAVPENGCLIVLVDGKNKKQKTKNNCKTYTHPPPTGRWLRKLARGMDMAQPDFADPCVKLLDSLTLELLLTWK